MFTSSLTTSDTFTAPLSSAVYSRTVYMNV